MVNSPLRTPKSCTFVSRPRTPHCRKVASNFAEQIDEFVPIGSNLWANRPKFEGLTQQSVPGWHRSSRNFRINLTKTGPNPAVLQFDSGRHSPERRGVPPFDAKRPSFGPCLETATTVVRRSAGNHLRHPIVFSARFAQSFQCLSRLQIARRAMVGMHLTIPPRPGQPTLLSKDLMPHRPRKLDRPVRQPFRLHDPSPLWRLIPLLRRFHSADNHPEHSPPKTINPCISERKNRGLYGTQGRTRTGTPAKAGDFESPASTIPPLGHGVLLMYRPRCAPSRGKAT